ncbi:alternative ribosome rescue aminoacyl-tRNA hydrolase ArfB [Flavobacterium sp. RHBU_3]|uniref:alternative ribosome rescue aminoacyl-tRNA hydrolase ArfB n=1 Tax=Flavobacterium sp. RHBU_3 TaxID=3391184 RepID=UPI003984CE0B
MDTDKILAELEYKAVRSSGAGGQNVNKVSSKVVLSFRPATSAALTDEEKLLVAARLANRINAEGQLVLHCDEDRSQLRNKELVTRRFMQLMAVAIKPEIPRKATRVPRAVMQKRRDNKARNSEKKQSRRRPDF